jgi:hypothetical protein
VGPRPNLDFTAKKTFPTSDQKQPLPSRP